MTPTDSVPDVPDPDTGGTSPAAETSAPAAAGEASTPAPFVPTADDRLDDVQPTMPSPAAVAGGATASSGSTTTSQPAAAAPRHPTAWEAPAGTTAASRPTMPAQWGSPLPALVSSVGALAAGYLISVLLVLLAWAGLGLASDSGASLSDAADQLDLQGVGGGLGAALLIGVHLMNMALGSRFVVSVHGGDEYSAASAHASIALPLLLLTCAYMAMAYWAARRAGRQWGVGNRMGTAAMALLGALATAIMATLVGRLCAFHGAEDEVSALGHSASAAGFFGTLVLAFLATWAGLNHGAGRRVLGQHPLVRETGRAVRTFLGHLVGLGGLVTLGGLVYVFVQGCRNGGIGQAFGSLLMVPLFIGNAIAWAFGLASFGQITAGASSSFAGHHTAGAISMFTFPWWVTLLVIIAMLGAIVVAGCYWASRRRVGRVSQQAEVFSWAVLPLTYLVGGLVLLALARISASGSLLSTDDSRGGGASLHLSGWTPLLLMLIGLLVDVAARYLSPLLVPMLPPALARYVPMGAAVATPAGAPVAAQPLQATSAVGQPMAGQALDDLGPQRTASPWEAGAHEATVVDLQFQHDQTQPVPVIGADTVAPDAGMAVADGAHSITPAQDAGVARAPMTPEARRRMRRILIAIGSLVALLVALVIAVAVLNATVFTARHKAQDVLGRVAAGDASKAAAELGTAAPQGNQTLLSSGVYSRTPNRVTDYTITSATTQGRDALVHAKTRQDSGVGDLDMQLTRHGHRYGLFNNWQVSSMPMGHVALQVPDGLQKVSINGADIDLTSLRTDGGTVSLPALPGTYTVKVPDQGKYFTGSQSDVPVGWSDQGDATELSVKLNDQFTKDLNAAIKAKIDSCAKTLSATVDNSCPWSGPYWDPTSMSSPAWKVDSYPTVDVQDQPDSQGRYYFSTDRSGQVELTYNEKDDDTSAPKAATPDQESIDRSGYATIQNDQVQVSFS